MYVLLARAPRRALAAEARPTPRPGRPCARSRTPSSGSARTAARRRLAEFAQQKAEQDRLLRGEAIEYVRAGADLLDADTLTFGFARRLAGYKRLSLLVADAERARAGCSRGRRPIQVLIAGKAHPRDATASGCSSSSSSCAT